MKKMKKKFCLKALVLFISTCSVLSCSDQKAAQKKNETEQVQTANVPTREDGGALIMEETTKDRDTVKDTVTVGPASPKKNIEK